MPTAAQWLAGRVSWASHWRSIAFRQMRLNHRFKIGFELHTCAFEFADIGKYFFKRIFCITFFLRFHRTLDE